MSWPLNRPLRPAVPPKTPPEWPADESRIAQIDELVYRYRRQGDMDLADAMLDRRNAIRAPRVPAVPVIPGRPA
jgi:hypothetical protein